MLKAIENWEGFWSRSATRKDYFPLNSLRAQLGLPPTTIEEIKLLRIKRLEETR